MFDIVDALIDCTDVMSHTDLGMCEMTPHYTWSVIIHATETTILWVVIFTYITFSCARTNLELNDVGLATQTSI